MAFAFTWDPAKAATNLEKHRVSFEEAISVFRDPLAWVFPDPQHSHGEHRELIIGLADTDRLLVVSFTERASVLRIISARPASARERRRHEEEHEG